MVTVCGAAFETFFNSTIIPLVFYASMATTILIAISFMVGRALANAKLTLWAKTEIVQLVISAGTVFFILITMQVFCTINVTEVAGIFEIPAPPQSLNVYQAAQEYLKEAALFSHNALTAVRYHLGAYTILAYLRGFMCDFDIGPIGIGCWYGWSGTNVLPIGGYGSTMAGLNLFFNGTIMAHMSALNSLFILLFVYKGFVFLFLPLGVFLRAMPYMRSFGSLLIAISLSFLLVYPLLLSIFYLMGDQLVNRGDDYRPSGSGWGKYLDESVFPNEEMDAGTAILSLLFGEDLINAFKGAEKAFGETYFGSDMLCSSEGNTYCVAGRPTETMGFAAHAFIAAIFFPIGALIATVASVSYLARLYGEEISLSRITQLV